MPLNQSLIAKEPVQLSLGHLHQLGSWLKISMGAEPKCYLWIKVPLLYSGIKATGPRR